jgi:dihydrodipicolinate synthase/N-acetylneuraminate lyase
MTKRPTLLGGVITALGTPLDERETLHVEGMRRQVRMQIDAGVDGLLVLGSMGAMQLLADETCREAIRIAVEEAAGRVPIVVGCGDTSTTRTIARIRSAEAFAVDGVAVVPPYFFKFTQAELAAYYSDLAAATRLPIYLYGVPAWTKHVLEFPLIEQLAKLDQVVGLKESGDLLLLRRCIEEIASPGRFVVLSGLTPFPDLALEIGADGVIDGLFAIAPELAVELLGASRRHDRAGATAARRKLLRLLDVILVDSIFGGFTAAMNLRGVPGNFAVRPYTQSTPEGRAKVRAILDELGLGPVGPLR